MGKRRKGTPTRKQRARAAAKQRKKNAGRSGTRANNPEKQRRASAALHQKLSEAWPEIVGQRLRSASFQGDDRALTLTMDDGRGGEPVALIIHGVVDIALGNVTSIAMPGPAPGESQIEAPADGEERTTEGGIILPEGVSDA